MKYVVSFGWDLGCDQMHIDYQRTFDSKKAADAYMWSIWKSNPNKYDLCRTFKEEEDLGPEYDSAGFTENDRIVNGQYRNN